MKKFKSEFIILACIVFVLVLAAAYTYVIPIDLKIKNIVFDKGNIEKGKEGLIDVIKVNDKEYKIKLCMENRPIGKESTFSKKFANDLHTTININKKIEKLDIECTLFEKDKYGKFNKTGDITFEFNKDADKKINWSNFEESSFINICREK